MRCCFLRIVRKLLTQEMINYQKNRKVVFVKKENNSIKKNVIYNTLFQALILFVPFITTPYVSRVLGADNIGQYSYAIAFVTYFSVVATLGSSIHGQRSVAFIRDDRTKLSETFWNIFFFRLFMVLITLALYIFFLIYFDGVSKVKLLAALNIINVVADISWFFQGLENFKKTVTRSLFVKIVSLISIFVFVRTKNDTWIYTLIICGSVVLGNLSLWRLLPKYVFCPQHIHPFSEFKQMLLVFLPTVATQVYMILDKTMIGWITKSDYLNGCYEQSEKIARSVITIVTSVGAVVLPRVANLYHKKDINGVRHYVYKAYMIVWAMSLPLMAGLLSVSSWLMPIYLGNGYELSIPLVNIFSLLIISVSLAYVTGFSYLIPTNQQNVYTVSVSIAALVNLVMNSVLIPQYGAIGAAIASVSAETIGTLIQLCYCFINKQLIPKKVFASVWKYLIASIGMYTVVILVKARLTMSIQNLFILIFIGAICYFLILIIFRDYLIMSFIKKLPINIQKHKE